MIQSASTRIPSMAEITEVIYGESSDIIYGWSYTLNRYLFENHRQEYIHLLHYLRNNKLSDYQSALQDMINRYQKSFHHWVSQLIESYKAKNKQSPMLRKQQGVGSLNHFIDDYKHQDNRSNHQNHQNHNHDYQEKIDSFAQW